MSWPIVELRTVCSKVSVGHVGKTSEFYTDESGIPFLRTQNVSKSGLNMEDVLYVTRDFHEKLKKSQLLPGDIVLSRVISTQINSAVIPDNFGTANCANIILVRPIKEKLDSDFLNHYLRSETVQMSLLKRQVGSAQSVVNTGVMKSWEIPLPPLHEQKRIAAILDKADAIRRKRQQAIQLADDFLRSVFLDMFGDPVTNPKGWEVKALKDIARIQIGPFGTQLHQKDYIENGIPLINPTHIKNGHILAKNDFTISEEKHSTLSEYHLEIGDIIMGRRGEMGRCAVVTEKQAGWLCGTGSLFIRPHNTGVFSEYLNKLLSSRAIKNHLESESQGATMPNLNKTIVGNIQIPVPSDEVLQKFTVFRHKLLKAMSSSINFNDQPLLESLGQKAFAGEL